MTYHWPLVVILAVVTFTNCNKLITILSDFTNDKDIDFFKNTFPWIVDNAASNIKFDFYFRDSGRNSGKRMCVLSQLVKNPYLQADYLRCEAKGDLECTKTLPIDIKRLNICTRLKVLTFIKKTEREFQKYTIEVTPVMILPRRQVISDLTPENILKSICGLYPSRKTPLGCVKPTPIPNPEEKSKTEAEPKLEEKPKLEVEPKLEEGPESEKIPEPKQEEKLKPEKNTKSEEKPKSEEEPKLPEQPKQGAEPIPEENSKPNVEPKPSENVKEETNTEQNTMSEEKNTPENQVTEKEPDRKPEEKIKSEESNAEVESKVDNANPVEN